MYGMNRTSLRGIIIPLVSLAVLIGIGYLAYTRISDHRVKPLGPNESRVSQEGRVDLMPNEASAVLPADVPVPSSAAETARFDVATRDGAMQGTRSYVTDADIATEQAAYEAYMTKNKWEIIDRQTGTGYAAVLAEREGQQLLASFTTRNNQTAVTVTAVQASR